MNARRTALTFAALAAAGTVAGLWWWTREVPATPAEAKEGAAPGASAAAQAAPRPRERLVDMRPLLTARRMAALATSPEEQELARQAERLADHSVDLAFADALRQAADAQPQTPEVRALAARKARAQAVLDADHQRLDRLSRDAAAAPSQERVRLEDAADVARAQLELDRDELNDAAEALERAGGDPQARVRRLKEAYEAAQKEPRPAPPALVAGRGDADSLVARVRAWTAQRHTIELLALARQEAREKAERLGKWRERLEQAIRAPAATGAASPVPAVATLAPNAAAAAPRPPGEAATGAAGAQLRVDERRLSVVAKRIQNQQDLADVYAEWISLGELRARRRMHELLAGVLLVLLALSAVYGASRAVDHVLARLERDELRNGTLRTLAKVAVQVAGALVVLFMALGVPAQATTIVGLAGAGLTVAMKDFIVAFFGWFVLMGRNGIRVGDWVEIKGVGGEVAEIGLLHTVLLETGSWTDAGHPTGRRVSFVNSFAIEGHYFNFSTSGQWMWDELRVLVPLGQDPYPVIDGVRKLSHDETEANAKLAEQEWLKATTRYRVRSFSAEPGINVVPTSSGVEVHVRYITRPFERHETRRRLYQSVFELMHGRRAGAA